MMDTKTKKFHFPSLVIFSFLIMLTSAISAAESKKIKFGVMSLAQPARIFQQWTPFVDYVNEKTGYEVEIVVPRGFKKIKQAIAKDKVDFFYTNSHVFYRLLKEGKAVPLAQMENLEGKIMSRSNIFVRSDSNIKNLQDLKGKDFAFVSPMGAGGYLAPRALFAKHGIKTKQDLSEKFTKNLSNSIHNVLLNEAQAGTMCGLNYKLMSKKIDTGELKVIAFSDDYPENIIGARPVISEKVRQTLTRVILGMPQDKKGAKVLQEMRGMKINKFVAYDIKVEGVIKNLMQQAGM